MLQCVIWFQKYLEDSLEKYIFLVINEMSAEDVKGTFRHIKGSLCFRHK